MYKQDIIERDSKKLSDNKQIWCTGCQKLKSGFMLMEEYSRTLQNAQWMQCIACKAKGNDCRRIKISCPKMSCRRSDGRIGCGQKGSKSTKWIAVSAPSPPVENC